MLYLYDAFIMVTHEKIDEKVISSSGGEVEKEEGQELMATTLADLKGFPTVDQLTNAPLDGHPDNNKLWNCVIACLLACILYYHPELQGKLSDDMIKDAVLGLQYANSGTDAAWFVSFLAKYGIRLYSTQVAPAHQPELAHQLLQQGIPVVLTEVDPYCSDAGRAQGWTHACVWHKEVTGGLVALDPFGGKEVERSDASWINQYPQLKGSVLWAALRIQQPVQAPKPTQVIPEGWRLSGERLIAPTGFFVDQGFMAYILDPANKWETKNMPRNNAFGIASGTQQDFTFCSLTWNAHDGVKIMPQEDYLVYLWSLIDHLDTLKTHDEFMITDLNARLAKAPDMSALQSAIAALEKDKGALQSQLAIKTGVTGILQALKPYAPAIEQS